MQPSTKTATERHPFGYGNEQFFWSFIVATMIFGISGILSLEQGFISLLGVKTHQITNVNISYFILAISACQALTQLHLIALLRLTKSVVNQSVTGCHMIRVSRGYKVHF